MRKDLAKLPPDFTADARPLPGSRVQTPDRDASSDQNSLHVLSRLLERVGRLVAANRAAGRRGLKTCEIHHDATDAVRAATRTMVSRAETAFEGDGVTEAQGLRAERAEEERQNGGQLAVVVEAEGVGSEVDFGRLVAGAAAGLEEGEEGAFLDAVGVALGTDGCVLDEDQAVDEVVDFWWEVE